MHRLLKFIPVVLTFVVKYLRSPQGKSAIEKVRSARRRRRTMGTTRRR